MKTPKLSILIVITAIAVNIISTLCGIFIWQCEDMLPTSKYSFTCIILGAVGVSVYFLIRLFQYNEAEKNQDVTQKKDDLINTLTAQIEDKEKEISKLSEELFTKKDLTQDMEKLQKKCEMVDTLTSQIADKDKRISEPTAELFAKRDLPMDMEKLQKKCETIEGFRNSFPFKVGEGYVIYNIIRLELTATYSKWLVVGIFEDELWSYPILRPENQKYKEMLSLIASTKSPEELKEFEQNENLFWE